MYPIKLWNFNPSTIIHFYPKSSNSTESNYINLEKIALLAIVSYHEQKLRLRWGTGAVTVNPELKLLQYDIGKPVVAEETVDYMLEKSGMIFV